MNNFFKIKLVKIKRFVGRNFSFIIRLYFNIFFFFLRFSKKRKILILTPGKVGSSSVYTSYKKILSDSYEIYHIHKISEKGIYNAYFKHLNSDKGYIPIHLYYSNFIRRSLNLNDENIKIVVLIREPISRLVSGFFQNIDFYSKSLEDNNLKININKSIQKLNKIIRETKADDLDSWFHEEIFLPFGIDLLDENFLQYKIIKNRNIEILMIKMEQLNKCFNEASQKFLNENLNFKLVNKNISKNKYYKDEYHKIKANLKIDKKTMDKIKNSRYVKTFYS